MTRMSGAEALVQALEAQGVERIFAVPGESYLAVLDALVDAPGIDLVTCRQEGGAAMMADADGKLTGRPGICFATRGPGACNASAGVHIAYQDSTPMILFIGQAARAHLEREAFQEMDYRRVFGEMAKWVAQVDDPARMGEFVSQAFHRAMNGRPGPVVLALPEDVLSAEVAATPPPPRAVRAESHPGAADMDRLQGLLGQAERPLLLVGGGAWTAPAVADVKAFAEAWSLPVCCAFRRQDLFDNSHPLYAGDVGIGINPALSARVDQTDLLIALGPRLGEMTTGGYTLLNVPVPAQPLVHIHPGAEELGRVYRPNLAINAGPEGFAAAAKALIPTSPVTWAPWTEAARADYLAWSSPTSSPGSLQLAEIVRWLGEEGLPSGAIICNGAGNYTAWVHRFHRYETFPGQLAPTSGSMGYGLPAAIVAKSRHPDRPVIAFAGDGCFLMTGQELATAVKERLKIIILVVNNSMYGTIRMHQERTYPGRKVGTDLVNPDFARLAEAYGAMGETVTTTADFEAAFRRARKAAGPALIELVLDADAITPQTTLKALTGEAG